MVDYDRIYELKIDEWVWVLFIFLSLLNIIGDECEKNYCIYKTIMKKNISKDIFIFTIFSSLVIYIYLEKKRLDKLLYSRKLNNNTFLWELRCFGGLLVIIATVLFLYCQVVDSVDPQIV